MEQGEAYPITYGILGLLAYWGPMSGYDIKQVFDRTLVPMWGAAHSQIYKELRRMKDFGWVEMEREEQESRPDRKVYSVTNKGLAALRDWQGQPAEVLQLRDELLLKLLFGRFGAPADLAKNIRLGIARHEERLREYRANALNIPPRGAFQRSSKGVGNLDKRPNPYATESEEDLYPALIAHFGIEFEKMYLRWLHEALAVVEQRASDEEP
jgi:PadR family transcriptional regulator AphA